MKRLIVRTHRLFYYLLAAKKSSFCCSLIYVSTLNLLIFYGFGLLLGDLFSTTIILKLYKYPNYLLLFTVMAVSMYLISPGWRNIELKRKSAVHPMVLIYSGISLLVLVYVVFIKHLMR